MKSKELKNIIIFTVAVIFITIGVGVGTFSILKYVDDKLQSKSMNQLLSQAIEEDVSKINWEKLNKINEDIVGWIQIENTDINYPILYNNKIDYLKKMRLFYMV